MTKHSAPTEIAVDKNAPRFVVSYHSEMSMLVRELVNALFKAGIQALAFPLDLDADAHHLITNLRRVQPRVTTLCLVASPTANRWYGEGFLRRITDALEAPLASVVELRFSASTSDEQGIPGTHQIVTLSPATLEYGLTEIFRLSGLHARASEGYALPASPLAAPFRVYVGGTFDTARSTSDLLAELSRVIDSGGPLPSKFLYWDVRSALRWKKLSELSTYLTTQSSTSLMAAHASTLANRIHAANPRANGISLIDFGVGTGTQDLLLTEALLQERPDTLLFVAVDESLSLVQLALQTLLPIFQQHPNRVRAQYILDDFFNIESHRPSIREIERETHAGDGSPVRIASLLGGSLGNFKESEILRALRSVLDEGDYVLVGVEFTADRADFELIRNYTSLHMKEFLFGPILDMLGESIDWWRDEYWLWKVVTADLKYTEVPASRTVVVEFSLHDRWMELASSTKYSRDYLERYFTQVGLRIDTVFLSQDEPASFGIYLLQIPEHSSS